MQTLIVSQISNALLSAKWLGIQHWKASDAYSHKLKHAEFTGETLSNNGSSNTPDIIKYMEKKASSLDRIERS